MTTPGGVRPRLGLSANKSNLLSYCCLGNSISNPSHCWFAQITVWTANSGKLGCILYCSWREFLPCCWLPQYQSVFLHISGLIYHFQLPFVYGSSSVFTKKIFPFRKCTLKEGLIGKHFQQLLFSAARCSLLLYLWKWWHMYGTNVC